MMRLGDYTIEVNGPLIKVSPAWCIDDEMEELIKRYKLQLMILLNIENNRISKEINNKLRRNEKWQHLKTM